MAKPATPITLSADEEPTLPHWVRSHKTERRMVELARIVLLAASGKRSGEIAVRLQMPPSRVSKWRLRCAQQLLASLTDRPRPPRPGKPAHYDEATRKRLVRMLDKARPKVTPPGRARCSPKC